jgi:hypothetical protein
LEKATRARGLFFAGTVAIPGYVSLLLF